MAVLYELVFVGEVFELSAFLCMMLWLKGCISVKAVSDAAKESSGRIGKEKMCSLENKL